MIKIRYKVQGGYTLIAHSTLFIIILSKFVLLIFCLPSSGIPSFGFSGVLWFCPPSSGRDKSLHYVVDTKNGHVTQGFSPAEPPVKS